MESTAPVDWTKALERAIHGPVARVAEHRLIPAGEFKARCLALLDEVDETGASLVVTKRGRAVALVVPVQSHQPASLAASIVHEGDLVEPIAGAWDAER